jgi:hypothetical protein
MNGCYPARTTNRADVQRAYRPPDLESCPEGFGKDSRVFGRRWRRTPLFRVVPLI